MAPRLFSHTEALVGPCKRNTATTSVILNGQEIDDFGDVAIKQEKRPIQYRMGCLENLRMRPHLSNETRWPRHLLLLEFGWLISSPRTFWCLWDHGGAAQRPPLPQQVVNTAIFSDATTDQERQRQRQREKKERERE